MPKLVSEHIAQQYALRYGWDNNIALDEISFENDAAMQTLPLDATRFAIKSRKKRSIIIWNSKTKTYEKTLKDYKGHLKNTAFSNGIFAAFFVYEPRQEEIGENNFIKVWDINTGECLRTFTFTQKQINSLTLSPNGTKLALCCQNTLHLLDIKTGKVLQRLIVNSPVCNVTLLDYPEEDLFIAKLLEQEAKNCRVVSLRKIPNGWEPELIHYIPGSLASLDPLTLLDAKRVVYSDGTTLNLIDTVKGKTRICENPLIPISIIDSTRLAWISGNSIKIWNTKTKSFEKDLKGHTRSIRKLISMNNPFLASASLDGSIKIWNVDTGTCVKSFANVYKKSIRTLDATDHVLVARDENIIRMIDIPTFEQTINFFAEKNSETLNLPTRWNWNNILFKKISH